jgi:SAM-dependent methyltransferase
MNHADHVRLLRDAVPAGGRWADLGSGGGAFTLALADCLGPQGEIYSIDKDAAALREQARIMHARFPEVRVHYLTADFTRPLHLPPSDGSAALLDGIVMANALHYVEPERKLPVVQALRASLQPGGRLVLVEYNVDRGNYWVPYPLSYPRWEALARQAGFTTTRLLARAPSSFLNEFYSAVSE